MGRQRAGERAWECLRILIDAQAGASARPGPAEGGPPGSQGAPRDVLPGTAGGGRDDQLPGLRVPPGPAGGTTGDFAVTAAGWDAACERLAGRIEALGWERFTYRPA